MRLGFARRLREAFDGASNAEIARRLNTTDATVKWYVDAVRLPVFEMLVEISRVTGINIHWLATGTGPRRVTKTVEMFSVDEEAAIRNMATAAGRSLEDQVRILTVEAMEFIQRLR